MDSFVNAAPRTATRAPGFTLIELLVTVAIVGIVTAVGLPSISQLLANSKVSSRTDLLIGSLVTARSKAIDVNARVTMCRSTTGTACAAAGDWRSGWIIFIDGDVAGVKNTDDTILFVQNELPAGGSIETSGNVGAYISYGSNGQGRTATGQLNGSFTICGISDKVARRRVSLVPGSGTVDVQRLAGSATCTA
jgi:type IV fimbrial biogenesis protein FimT